RLASEQIGVLEINRIDFRGGNEPGYFHRAVRLRLEFFQFLVGKGDVAILLDFVAADQLAAVDDLVFLGAINLLLDPALVFRVKQMESDRFGTRSREQSHRNGDESEGQTGG